MIRSNGCFPLRRGRPRRCRSSRGRIRRSSEQAEANKAKDQANLENAQRDLARYAAIVNTQLAVSRQQYDTQRATVQQDEVAVQSDQAQIDAAKLNVAYCEITSPIDGVTGLRLVDIGILCRRVLRPPRRRHTDQADLRHFHHPRMGSRPHPGGDGGASVIDSGVQWR